MQKVGIFSVLPHNADHSEAIGSWKLIEKVVHKRGANNVPHFCRTHYQISLQNGLILHSLLLLFRHSVPIFFGILAFYATKDDVRPSWRLYEFKTIHCEGSLWKVCNSVMWIPRACNRGVQCMMLDLIRFQFMSGSFLKAHWTIRPLAWLSNVHDTQRSTRTPRPWL